MTVWGVDAAEIAASWGVPLVELHDRLTSTNDRAIELVQAGAPAPAVVLADEQRQGRGRRGKHWHSPPGVGVWLSVLLRTTASPSLPLRVGLAVSRALELWEPADRRLSLKWPNDLWIDDLKVGGVLCEQQQGHCVVGVGLDVTQGREEFPEEIRGHCTSLRGAGWSVPSRLALAGAVATSIIGIAADEPLSEDERTAWHARDAFRGRRVRVQAGDRVHEGRAIGLTPGGALQIEADNGARHSVVAGSVDVVG